MATSRFCALAPLPSAERTRRELDASKKSEKSLEEENGALRLEVANDPGAQHAEARLEERVSLVKRRRLAQRQPRVRQQPGDVPRRARLREGAEHGARLVLAEPQDGAAELMEGALKREPVVEALAGVRAVELEVTTPPVEGALKRLEGHTSSRLLCNRRVALCARHL